MSEDQDTNGESEKLRFKQLLDRSDLVLSELHSVDGARLRAARSLQETIGISKIAEAIDHTLVFHIGGSLNVRRFYDGQLSGVANKLRTTTMMPAFRSAEWDLGGEVDVLHIYLDHVTLESIAEEGFGLVASEVEILDKMCVDDEVIAALAPILLQEMASEDPASILMLDSFEQVIGTHILRRYSSRAKEAAEVIARPALGGDGSAVEKAMAYLLERQAENVSLKEVADHVGLSKFHLQRRFRADLGISPHEYVMQARIKRVRDCLKGSTKSLADIAFDCGFSSQQHMTNVFSRHMGISPGRFRKQIMA